jgi:hypothetical protein
MCGPCRSFIIIGISIYVMTARIQTRYALAQEDNLTNTGLKISNDFPLGIHNL